jgi:hypothetical protein
MSNSTTDHSIRAAYRNIQTYAYIYKRNFNDALAAIEMLKDNPRYSRSALTRKLLISAAERDTNAVINSLSELLSAGLSRNEKHTIYQIRDGYFRALPRSAVMQKNRLSV